MKKPMLLLAVVLLSVSTFSQNTFPTNGNVGINTTAPSARLDVNGNMKIDSSLTVKDSVTVEKDMRTKGKFTVEDKAYFLKLVTMYEKLQVFGNIIGESNIRALNNVVAENNVDVGNNVNVANNVNIGNKLNVTGTSNLDGIVKMPNLPDLNNLNDPNVKIMFRMPNGSIRTRGLSDFLLDIGIQPNIDWLICDPVFAANPYWISMANKLFTVCPDVYVGINTADPFHLLHVNGTAYSENLLVGNKEAPKDAVINGYINNNSDDLLHLGKQLGSGLSNVIFRIGHDGNIYYENQGSQPSFVLHNGTGHAIVINDNNGDKILQLENSGFLRSRRIRVDADQWADYVFNEGYALMSLRDVEKFINDNGHLPNVPSAAEIEENGVDVAEMDKIQMEKIEEIYLHMIDLEKRITELEEENKELKNRLPQE